MKPHPAKDEGDSTTADQSDSDSGSDSDPKSDPKSDSLIPARPEPRWMMLLTVLTTGALYAGIEPTLAVGPSWLLLVIVTCFSIAAMISHRLGSMRWNTILGFVNEAIMTIFLLWSVILLLRSLPRHTIPGPQLLRSAAVLWISNVFLFALWYWRLDGGGPYQRFERGHHKTGAFLFPPMTNDGRRAMSGHWSPMFIDYLFLSFNTSTALSPTDAPILSRWAKVLVMIQAVISLAIVLVLAARAVNIM